MTSQPELADAARPVRSVQSTEVPCTITRPDGTTIVSTARVVHPAGARVPERVDHVCGPACGRCPS